MIVSATIFFNYTYQPLTVHIYGTDIKLPSPLEQNIEIICMEVMLKRRTENSFINIYYIMVCNLIDFFTRFGPSPDRSRSSQLCCHLVAERV